MIKKYILFNIPIVILLLNINCFFFMKFESIYNFAIIIFMVGILYFFMFKYTIIL